MFDRNEKFLEPEFTTSLQNHTIRTFAWMAAGLFITTITAFIFYSSASIMPALYSPYMPLVLAFAQIGIAIAFAGRLMKMSATGAKSLFLIYSVITGIVFSYLARYYLPGTLAAAFLVTTVYFGSLVAIGLTTKMNILRFGPIIFSALIAFIISEVVMMFIGASIYTMLMSGIGLLIFTALTVYDVQKMKRLYVEYECNEEMLSKLSIYSAFEFYLDFINIFIYILRFLKD